MFSNLRIRFSKRAIVLFAVMAFALSATGISSLARLEDTVNATINASLTTIDLKVNGTKAATIDMNGLTPGDIGYAALVFTNTGTGYVRIPSDIGIVDQPTGDLTLATRVAVAGYNWDGSGTMETCRAELFGAFDWPNANLLTDALWGGYKQLEAGDTLGKCVAFKLGDATTYAQTSWSTLYTFPAYYP